MKSAKCFACNNPTNGIFNCADVILEKLEKKKAAIEKIEKKQKFNNYTLYEDEAQANKKKFDGRGVPEKFRGAHDSKNLPPDPKKKGELPDSGIYCPPC